MTLQVGMILRGMGFDNTTSVYVASGKIYKEEKYMAPLRQLFPLLETKYTLASAEELAPFEVLCFSYILSIFTSNLTEMVCSFFLKLSVH